MNNYADLLLRVRQDKKSREDNDADLLLRVRGDKKSRIENDADLLLKVRQEKKSRVENDADLFLRVMLFVALRPKSTAMVIAGRSVHLITLFPGQA